MLYNTHKRYGQVFGVASMPLMAQVGVLDSGNMGTIGFVGMCLVGLLGAMYGAKFPDFDSPTSRASREHKIESSLFRVFGVKHRGKFSHDITVQTLFWAIIITIINYLSLQLDFKFSVEVFSFVKVFVVFTYIGVLSHLVADSLTVEGTWLFGFIKIKLTPNFARKIKIFGWKPLKKLFTTSSNWNDYHYKFLTFILPILSIVVIIDFYIK